MEVQSIRDLIIWTQNYHQQLEDCYKQSGDNADQERISMLLDYFQSHEHKLAAVYEKVLLDQKDS